MYFTKEIGNYNVEIYNGQLNRNDNCWYYVLNLTKFNKDGNCEGQKNFYIKGHQDQDIKAEFNYENALKMIYKNFTKEELDQIYHYPNNYKFIIPEQNYNLLCIDNKERRINKILEERDNQIFGDGLEQGLEEGYKQAIQDFTKALTDKKNIQRYDIDEIIENSLYGSAYHYFTSYINGIAKELQEEQSREQIKEDIEEDYDLDI